MSHTTEWHGRMRLDEPSVTADVDVYFIHDGDYGGNVKIILEAGDWPGGELTLPFEAIKFIAGEYVRDRRTGELEDADTDELLR